MKTRIVNIDRLRVVDFVRFEGSDVVMVHNRSGLSFMKMVFSLFSIDNRDDLRDLIFMPAGIPPVMHIDDMNTIMMAGSENNFVCSLYEFPVGTDQEVIDKQMKV